jgi:hypothetical protein
MPVDALICGKCNAENGLDVDACCFCGTPLTEEAGVKKISRQPPAPPPKPHFFATLRGALVVSITILFLFFLAAGTLAPKGGGAATSFYNTLGDVTVALLAIYWVWFLFVRPRTVKQRFKN